MAWFQHCCTSKRCNKNRGNKSYVFKTTKIPSDLMSLMKKKKRSSSDLQKCRSWVKSVSTKAQKMCGALFIPVIGKKASRLFCLPWEHVAYKSWVETIHSGEQNVSEVWVMRRIRYTIIC